MQNNNKLRAALLAAVVLCGSGVSCVRADNVFGTAENGWHTVIDSDYDGNVYGNNGNPDADNVVTGHVEMTDGSVKNIYGGYSESGPVSGSTATVSGGTVGALVYGGHSGIGSVSWNKAILTGGTVKVIAGGANNFGEVFENTVCISGGQVTIQVYGGRTPSGDVHNNTVTLRGKADVSGAELFGGRSEDGTVSKNILNLDISDGSFNNVKVYGGYAEFGTVHNNTITLCGNGDVSGAELYGGYNNMQGTVSGNTLDLDVSGGNFNNTTVYGGYAQWGDVKDNTITLCRNGDVSGAELYGGYSKDGDVSGNTLNLDVSGGKINATAYGGYAQKGNVQNNTIKLCGAMDVSGAELYGGYNSEDGDVSGNTLILDVSGKINAKVYGGKCEKFGNVQNNTIKLCGTTDVSGAELYGGYSEHNTVSGNTLVLDGWSGGTVGGLHNFDTIRFENVDLSQDTVSLTAVNSVDDVTTRADIEIDSFDMESLAGIMKAGGEQTTIIEWSDKFTGGASFTENFQNQAAGVTEDDTYKVKNRDNGGVYAGKWTVTGHDDDTNDHEAQIDVAVQDMILTNRFLDETGVEHTNEMLELSDGFTTNVANVSGVYAAAKKDESQNATGGALTISGTSGYAGNVYGGYAENGSATDNTITLKGATAEKMNLYGGNTGSFGNTLVVDGVSSTVGSLHNFSAVDFQNVALSEVKNSGNGTEISLAVADGGMIEGMDNATVRVSVSGLPAAGDVQMGTLYKASVSWNDIGTATADITGISAGSQYGHADRTGGGLYVNRFNTEIQNEDHKAVITSIVGASALTGRFIDTDGTAYTNTLASEPLVIGEGFTTDVDTVAGVYDVSSGENIKGATDGQVYISGTPAEDFDKTIYGGYSKSGNAEGNHVFMTDGQIRTIIGGFTESQANGVVTEKNYVEVTNGSVDTIVGGYDGKSVTLNTVEISGDAQVGAVTGGWTENGTVSGNHVIVSGGTVRENIYGGYIRNEGEATGNTVRLSGGKVMGNVYGGFGYSDGAKQNKVILSGTADVSDAMLYGGGTVKFKEGAVSGNTLVIDGWNSSSQNGNSVISAQNFGTITFQNLNWKEGGVALNITDAKNVDELANTSVLVDKLVLETGTSVQAGDKMTFIQSNKDTGLSVNKVSVTEDASFSQGVATVGELEMKLEGATNNLVGEIKGVGLNPQTAVIAENRTAAAAFLNQGADIAADSLDLLGSDYKYGLRTFGAVYGNRSTYDAAGDMKLNGWSEIVGLGNVHRKGDGDLSWGVFYENGTGNYRTWNEFNNEMFRGDGSLLYNGGGAALRYKQDDGWYYEAGVRAGTLSASMENAVKDGNGNSYGFDSDSTYWGVHAGLGKLIETGRGEWNVYGKYFHTDIDGDSFTVGGDRFAFDSLTSDRLRLGARYTADRAKRWSLYCGLAWEYEFSGDSHMKAGQWDAPEQSLGGSTGIAEIGTVWQPDDSPWQANINLKGYAGERDGFSGMVQLAYTF